MVVALIPVAAPGIYAFGLMGLALVYYRGLEVLLLALFLIKTVLGNA